MEDEYKVIYGDALEFLKTVVQRAGTFLPETTAQEEEQLDKHLSDLNGYLRRRGEKYKYAVRRCMKVRDILLIEYWADISRKGGREIICQGLEELCEPENITRASNSQFLSSVLDRGFTFLPVTKRAKKDIAEAKKKLG